MEFTQWRLAVAEADFLPTPVSPQFREIVLKFFFLTHLRLYQPRSWVPFSDCSI
jgi:hypothetical protein